MDKQQNENLKLRFEEIGYKIKIINGPLYETIMPIRAELMGTRETPDDNGQLGALRNNKGEFFKDEVLLLNIVDNTNKLNKWSECMIQHQEEIIEELKSIITDAFEVIDLQNKKLGGKITQSWISSIEGGRKYENKKRIYKK